MRYNKETKPSMDFIYGKIPPNAVELEEAVLGAILWESDCMDLVLEIIHSSECFYKTAHQHIYEAILDLYRANKKVDLLTVTDKLRKLEKLDEVGGSFAITKLTMGVVSSAHVEAHARIVMEKYALRELIRISGGIIQKSYDNSNDVFDLIDEISACSTDITDKMIQKQFEHIQHPMQRLIEETIQKVDSTEKIFGISTGFKELDHITSGWQKQDLIILAARPSVGKTAFSLNLLLGAVGLNCMDIERQNMVALIKDLLSAKKAKAVAFFSLEMPTVQLMQRMAANVCEIELNDLRNGNLTQDQLELFIKTSNAVKSLPMYFDDNPTLNSTILRAKARKLKKLYGIELIIIDYLQLMEGDSSYKGNREQEISKISRDLKKLAKDLDIPVIALSQMSRAVEARSSSRPQLSDLRESGAIEQDADMVLFLYKPTDKEIKEKPYIRYERYLDIAKYRSGNTADLSYEFRGEFQRFTKEDISIIDVKHSVVKEKKFIPPAYNSFPPAANVFEIQAPSPQMDDDTLPF